MTIILSGQEHQDLIDGGYQTQSQTAEESELYIDYPEQLGHAYRWRMTLRPGFELRIKDHYYSKPLIIKQPEREHPIELSFCLSGYRKDSVFDHVSPGTSKLFGNGICPQEDLTFFPNQQLLGVDLHLKPEVFQTLFPQESDSYPKLIQALLQHRTEWLYAVSGKITPSMELVLQQILNCPYGGLMKRLYLESKALELITLQLEQLLDQPNQNSHQSQLSDIDCIHHARHILEKALNQAPTLSQLARQVGLNERKLKEGFQQVFQTTPFEYLRDRRLEQAKHLLLDTNQSVQEVARAIGYRSRSQFANAFRQKFGVNPKAYQRH